MQLMQFEAVPKFLITLASIACTISYASAPKKHRHTSPRKKTRGKTGKRIGLHSPLENACFRTLHLDAVRKWMFKGPGRRTSICMARRERKRKGPGRRTVWSWCCRRCLCPSSSPLPARRP
eukprot:277496-Rhodomonas_salina.1